MNKIEIREIYKVYGEMLCKGDIKMIDICFNLSVEGNLNAIKHQLGNPTKTDDIVLLDLQLNYGLLNGDLFEIQSEREAKIHKSFFANVSEKELNSLCKKKFKSIKSTLAKLDKKLKNGDGIRLWLSNNAFDRCGLYWFCDYARKYDCKIYTVICPGIELVEDENKFIENTRWAAFSDLPYMASFTEKAVELSKSEINLYSELWQKLVKENAPLRVLIDDRVISTTEDFYDSVILSCITKEPKPQITIIGDFLERWYCADYCFISERIEHLLKQGQIEIVDDKVNDEGSYVVRTLKLK